MIQFINLLNSTKCQGRGFYSTPVVEGLVGAIEFYDHYATPNQLDSFHVILVTSSFPNNQVTKCNHNSEYDNLSLNDVCNLLKQRNCKLSIINSKKDLNSVFNLMSLVNDPSIVAEDCSNLNDSGFIVKLAGIQFAKQKSVENGSGSQDSIVVKEPGSDIKALETQPSHEHKPDGPNTAMVPKTPLKSGDLLGSFLDTQALDNKPNKDDLMDFLESQDLLQNQAATTQSVQPVQPVQSVQSISVLPEDLVKPITNSPQELEINPPAPINPAPASGTIPASVPSVPTPVSSSIASSVIQVKEEPKAQAEVSATSVPPQAVTPIQNTPIPISTPQVAPAALPIQPPKPMTANPQVNLIWNGIISWPNEHNPQVPNVCPLAAIPLPGAQGPVPIERYQVKMWPPTWTINRLMPLMLEWWKSQVQMHGIPCVNLVPSPNPVAPNSDILIKYQTFLKFLEMRNNVGVIQFLTSGLSSYGIVILSHQGQLTGLVFLNNPIPTMQTNPMIQQQPMMTPEIMQLRANILSQLPPQQQLQLQQNPQLLQQFLMSYLTRLNQQQQQQQQQQHLSQQQQQANLMNMNANMGAFNNATSNPQEMNLANLANMNPMMMNINNLNQGNNQNPN
jgi:hypothetical protein